MNKIRIPQRWWTGCVVALSLLVSAPIMAQDDAEREREQAREELREAKEQLREASQRVAEISQRIGMDAVHAQGFAYASSGRPVLGVVLGESNSPGARINAVTPGSAASDAGLRSGDRIVAIDGASLVDSERRGLAAARAALSGLSTDQEVRLSLIRNDQRMERSVTPESAHSWSFSSDGDVEMWVPQIVIPDIVIPDFDMPDFDVEFDESWADAIEAQVEAAMAAAGLGTEIAAEVIERARAEREHAKGARDHAKDERDRAREVRREARREARSAARVARDERREHNREERRILRVVSPSAPGSHRVEMSSDDSNLSLSALNPELGRYFGIDRGVLILASDGSDYRDLQAGDVILEVAGNDIESPRQAWRELREGDAGTSQQVTVWRERERMDLSVTVPEHRFAPLPPSAPRPPSPPRAPSPPSPPPPPVAPVAPIAPVVSSDGANQEVF